MNKKQEMYERIEKHGKNLNQIFHTSLDNIALCKKLRHMERKAHQLATDYCNEAMNTEKWTETSEIILEKVDKVLQFRRQNIPVFTNSDCRGYTLKIKSEYMVDKELELYRDWGGYGLIAPDLTN